MKIAFEQNRVSTRNLLCERAYRQLKRAVVKGKLKADERLIETKLADKMGISRTPVREAIHKLEREGFVYKLPAGGHAVSSSSERDVRETQSVAGILLGYAAYLATSNATDNDLKLLRRIVKQAEDHLRNGNHRELVNTWDRFCSTLLLLSRNNRLGAIFNRLKDDAFQQLPRLRDTRKKHVFLNDERTLIDLMEAKQAARAEKLARTILLKNNDIPEGQQGMAEYLEPSERRLKPTG